MAKTVKKTKSFSRTTQRLPVKAIAGISFDAMDAGLQINGSEKSEKTMIPDEGTQMQTRDAGTHSSIPMLCFVASERPQPPLVHPLLPRI